MPVDEGYHKQVTPADQDRAARCGGNRVRAQRRNSDQPFSSATCRGFRKPPEKTERDSSDIPRHLCRYADFTNVRATFTEPPRLKVLSPSPLLRNSVVDDGRGFVP